MITKLIFDCPVNSKEEIESLLNDHSEVEFKTSEIERLEFRLGTQGLKDFPRIGPLIAQVCTNILGFVPVSGMCDALDASQRLCEQSLVAHKEEILPLVISALKCHREALLLFVNQSHEAATQEMKKTGDLATQMEGVYRRLRDNFQSSSDSFFKQVLKISERRVSFCERIREFDPLERDAQQNACMAAYSRASQHLGQTVHLGFEAHLQFGLGSSFYFGQQLKCQTFLQPSTLGDEHLLAALLELEKENSPPRADLIPDMISVLSFPKEEPSTLCEVMGSMKSGGSIFLEKPQEMILASIYAPSTVRETFEISYLKWLTVAKVSFERERVLGETIDSIRQAKQGIAWIHEDPLAIALNSSPDW